MLVFVPCGAVFHVNVLSLLAMGAFPMRQEKSVSEDEDYAARSHRKKFYIPANMRDTPDSGFADSDGAIRRGAAKKVTTYNEAEADYVIYQDEGEGGGGESFTKRALTIRGRRKRRRN
jgi:chromodomain-helicase-DNA-binding protein 1